MLLHYYFLKTQPCDLIIKHQYPYFSQPQATVSINWPAWLLALVLTIAGALIYFFQRSLASFIDASSDQQPWVVSTRLLPDEVAIEARLLIAGCLHLAPSDKLTITQIIECSAYSKVKFMSILAKITNLDPIGFVQLLQQQPPISSLNDMTAIDGFSQVLAKKHPPHLVRQYFAKYGYFMNRKKKR